MSFANATELSILSLWLAGTAWADFAENDTTSPQTNHWLSLHTADPTDTGTQTSSEATYTDYERDEIIRTSGATGFDVSANPCLFSEDHPFVQASGGTNTITHFGIGKNQTTAGTLNGSGTVTPNIAVATSVTPILTDATSFSLD